MKKLLCLLCLLLMAPGIYAASADSYQDGTYVAQSTGFGGPVIVIMTVDAGRIVAVEIQGEHETPGIGQYAMEQLPEAIINANGVASVDVITGATHTSRAILAAAAICIEDAYRGNVASSTPAPTATPTPKPTLTPPPSHVRPYHDGLYIAQATGFGGPVVVIMTIKDGRIVSLEIQIDNETMGIADSAKAELAAAIWNANGIEGVDVAVGATFTSRAILAAAAECFEASYTGAVSTSTPVPTATPTPTPTPTPGPANADYRDGTYTAQATGFGGPVSVTMTIKNGRIVSVSAKGKNESQSISGKALEELPEMIKQANGVGNVDVVAGASVTSRAILAAAAECLNMATTPSRIPGDPDGDGSVTLNDAVMILQYGTGESGSMDVSTADVNGDGTVSIHDALCIFQHEAGWDGVLR